MKTKNYLLCALLMGGLSLYGQVKIGDNPETISPASLLELESTDKALVVSRVSTAQMNAIMPNEGAIVFNTDVACLFYYDGLQWNNMCEELPIEFATEAIVNTAPTMVITQNGDVLNFEVGQISSENIVDFSIAGLDIQNNTITDEKLAANSVGTEELQDNTITDLEINYAEVTLSDFTNDADFITAADILSADDGNDLSFGLDGGAYFNAEPFEIAINQLEANLDLKEDVANKSADVTLGNSNILYPTQNAVKTYVDNAVGGSAQTIVSGDPGNSITPGNLGGAFLNITPLQNQVGTLQGDLTTHIAADQDLDDTNELILNAELIGTDLIIEDAGNLWEIPLAGLGGGGGTDSQQILDFSFDPVTFSLNLDIENAAPVPPVDLSVLAGGGGGTPELATVLTQGNGAGDQLIKNLLDPVDPQDAATKAYVDNAVAGAGGGGTQDLASVLTQGNDGAGQLIKNILDPEDPQDAATRAFVEAAIAGGGAPLEVDGTTIEGTGIPGDPFRVVPDGITNNELALDAVTTENIVDNTVTLEKILASVVDGQVLTSQGGESIWANPSAGAVLTDATTINGDGTLNNELSLADDAVTTTKILDAAVTPEKINPAPGNENDVLTIISGVAQWSPPPSGGIVAATDVTYDNTNSGLAAPNLQVAVDSLSSFTSGEPGGIFFGNPNGNPTTNAASLIWDQDKRFTTGALGIGIDSGTLGDNSKVHIMEDLPGEIAYALQVQNQMGGAITGNDDNGTSVGVLFSVEGLDTFGKGGLVYERTSGWARGSFHILQNQAETNTLPSLDDAVFTVTSFGDVGIGTTTPTAKLEVEGQTLTKSLSNEGFYLDESGAAGADGQILSATPTGTLWVNAGAGGDNLSTTDLIQQPATVGRTYDLNEGTLIFSGTGNIGISTTAIAPQDKLDVDGQIRARNGFAATEGSSGQPSYGFYTNGDTDTGMYRFQEDEIRFSTGGSDALTIDNNQNIGITETAPTSSLHLGGSFAAPIDSATTDLTLTAEQHTVILDQAGITVTLPSAADANGRIYILKNTSGGSVTTNINFKDSLGANEDTISGVVWLQSDGTNWQQIN